MLYAGHGKSMNEKAVNELLHDLQAQGDPVFAAHHTRFFQAFPGGYGDGDRFFGLKVPVIRATALRRRAVIGLPGIASLLASPWHEARMSGLMLLCELAKKSFKKRQNTPEGADWREAWNKGRAAASLAALPPSPEEADYADCAVLYLACIDGVNNWDLVDLSAPWLLGPAVQSACPGLEETLAAAERPFSGKLWLERIAVLSTLYCIRAGNFSPTLRMAEKFIHHPHDLIHKAVGWLLRELGKKTPEGLAALRGFLDRHAEEMPRTMLRYALERFSPEEKAFYMKFGKKTATAKRAGVRTGIVVL